MRDIDTLSERPAPAGGFGSPTNRPKPPSEAERKKAEREQRDAAFRKPPGEPERRPV